MPFAHQFPEPVDRLAPIIIIMSIDPTSSEFGFRQLAS